MSAKDTKKEKINLKQKVVNYLNSIDYEDNMKSLLWAAVIALIFRTFLFEPFRIPSTSMLPTLRVGDFFFASKYDYGYSMYSLPIGSDYFEGRIMGSAIPRGDIVVFKIPKDSQYYIKRIVGLPGDRIQLKRGDLYINDIPCQRKYEGVYKDIGPVGQIRIFNKYVETLPNGVRYHILDSNINNHRDFPDTTAEYIVPQGHYFMMGDNRNNSRDSRYIGGVGEMGFIPERNIVGKAYFILWTATFSPEKLWNEFDSVRDFKLLHNNQMMD